MAHLKKTPALLSVCDALQMSLDLRESLIEVVSNPHDYEDDMGSPDRIASVVTISFTNGEKIC